MTTRTDVAVVGAGTAGLVTARHLADRGFGVACYEREATVGGRVRSTRRDGFVLDRGFQVLFTAYPSARRELDYDALDLRYFTPGAVIARPGHRAVLGDPLRDPSALTESLFNTDVTTRDKLETLALRRELSRRPNAEIFGGDDGSIRDYLTDRGFSEKFVENFAAPFYGGITLDRSLSTSKKVFEFTFKMLSEGRIAVPAEGMGAIPEQLAENAETAGASIHLDSAVETVDAADDGATLSLGGETVEADAVVVAADPRTARELTDVESIPTEAHGCVTQYYVLPNYAALDAGKRPLLNAGSAAPNQVVPVSEVAPDHAPPDSTLISATFLGRPEASDADLAATTREALERWYPARGFDDFELLHTDRIEFAQFAQPPGIFETLPGVDAPEGRCFLAGEYTEASSLNAAMASGMKAARAVDRALGR